ncbi:hypothetical protein Q1695_013248 [Nippostrongylus brasiliensis]|nr:hypothetical protein Q1695_013248 [Nippostrongylus brasiliensis]
MLIIYWLAVVFHLSLAGQVVVRDEVETTTTTTTTTTTRQSSPEPMPPMDPKTRFYHQFGSAPGGGFQSWELYMVLNNRKTWYEARKHCQHNELDLVFMDTIGMVTILSIFRELTKKEDLPQNEVLWHGVPKGWNTPNSEFGLPPPSELALGKRGG